MQPRVQSANAGYEFLQNFCLRPHVFFRRRAIRNFLDHLLEVGPKTIEAPLYEVLTILVAGNFLYRMDHFTKAGLVDFFCLKLSEGIGNVAKLKAE